METVVYDRLRLAAERNISYCTLVNLVPLKHYSHPVVGSNKTKAYHSVALAHFDFRNLLRSCPRLTTAGVSALLRRRDIELKRNKDHWVSLVENFVSQHPEQVDRELEAYPIVESILCGIALSSVQCLLPRDSDYQYLVGCADITRYYRNLSDLIDRIELDLIYLETHFGTLGLGNFLIDIGLRASLDSARHEVMLRISNHVRSEQLYTASALRNLVKQVHHTNLPYLWADVLTAWGHLDIQVTDGARDGNRDVVSKLENQIFYTQVKAWGYPVGEELVRQLANTCRTYNVKRGFFVTSNRFSKGAVMGQWPQITSAQREALRHLDDSLSINDKIHIVTGNQDKIAEIELIDVERLVSILFKYRIGALPNDTLDLNYWDCLRIPSHRKVSS